MVKMTFRLHSGFSNSNRKWLASAWIPLILVWVMAAIFPVAGAELQNPLFKIESRVKGLIPFTHPCVVGINGSGSGVIVSSDGLVLTAAHVVTYRGNRCQIQLPDGTQLPGRKLGMNSDRDAAMVQIEADGPFPFCEVRFAPLSASEWVVSMGHAQGFNPERKPPVRFGRLIKPHRDSLGPLGFLMTDCTIPVEIPVGHSLTSMDRWLASIPLFPMASSKTTTSPWKFFKRIGTGYSTGSVGGHWNPWTRPRIIQLKSLKDPDWVSNSPIIHPEIQLYIKLLKIPRPQKLD